MTYRPFFSSLVPAFAASVFVGLSATSAEAAIQGVFNSPIGAVRVSEDASGNVAAVITSATNACKFPVGKQVLSGSRFDDSVVGTMILCGIGDGCAGEKVADVILLAGKGEQSLSGAVHHGDKCKTPVAGDAVVFRKPRKDAPVGTLTAPPKAPVIPTIKPTAKGKLSPRERALLLAAEADALMREAAGRVEAARAKFREAVAIDPTYAAGYGGIGVTYYLVDRYDDALASYKQAIEVDPSYSDAYYNMASVLALLGERDQSLHYLRMALLNGYSDLDTLTGVDHLQADQDFRSLRADPVFVRLVKGDLSPIVGAPLKPIQP
jgi:hypothetical protein